MSIAEDASKTYRKTARVGVQWASNRYLIGTDIELRRGPSLLTTATQLVAVAVSAGAALGVLVWTALLATGLTHLTPKPGLFGEVHAVADAADTVITIGGYVVLIDLVCAAVLIAVHVHNRFGSAPTSGSPATRGAAAAGR
ncbi:MAG: hypothetical protein WBD41_17735 [Rhodococcus sp. (in: high G+C Gram-positive bacteria)]